MDLADAIATEARELFGALPEGEVADDEALEFTLYGGHLVVFLPRTGHTYRREAGATFRFEPRPDGSTRVTRFIAGKRRGRRRFTRRKGIQE